MTIQSDIVSALSSVAGGRVAHDTVEQNTPMPFVICRRIGHEPSMTLNGYGGITKSIYAFDYWAATKNGAIAGAAEVVAAIEAAATVGSPAVPGLLASREPAPVEEFEPTVLQYVESVAFSFWHA